MTYKNRAELFEENAKLRAEIDNLQAGRSAPTILEVLDEPGFERMTEMFPHGFRESGTPVRPTDSAMEVMWSMVRYVRRVEERIAGVSALEARIADLTADAETMRSALVKYAIRALWS